MSLANFSSFDKEIQYVVKSLVEIYDDECENIILYGSTAQNKLTYRIENGKIDFFSDIEFLVIPKDPQNENNKLFNKKMIDKSSDFLDSCHNIRIKPYIDVNSVSRSFFSEADLRISIFELKNNGMVLKGENILDILPDVNINNYNPQIQSIEIVKGLKILLLESYNWFLNNDLPAKEEEEKFNYFLSSSFLNILRTLLPILGHFKLSNEERISLISSNLLKEELSLYFSRYIINQFIKVLNDKEECQYSHTTKELFSLTYEGYKSMLCMMFACSEEKLLLKIHENREEVFWGTTLKVEQLAQLLEFFLSALDCLNRLINGFNLLDEDIDTLTNKFDILIKGRNAYRLTNILDKYKELERTRWKIIGSKD